MYDTSIVLQDSYCNIVFLIRQLKKLTVYFCTTLKGLFLIILYHRKYDFDRKITLPNFYESNIKMFILPVNTSFYYVFCLDLNLCDHKVKF